MKPISVNIVNNHWKVKFIAKLFLLQADLLLWRDYIFVHFERRVASVRCSVSSLVVRAKCKGVRKTGVNRKRSCLGAFNVTSTGDKSLPDLRQIHTYIYRVISNKAEQWPPQQVIAPWCVECFHKGSLLAWELLLKQTCLQPYYELLCSWKPGFQTA